MERYLKAVSEVKGEHKTAKIENKNEVKEQLEKIFGYINTLPEKEQKIKSSLLIRALNLYGHNGYHITDCMACEVEKERGYIMAFFTDEGGTKIIVI